MKVLCILLVVSMVIMIASARDPPSVGGTISSLSPEGTHVDWEKCKVQINACYKPGLSYTEVVATPCHKDAEKLPECQLKEGLTRDTPIADFLKLYGN